MDLSIARALPKYRREPIHDFESWTLSNPKVRSTKSRSENTNIYQQPPEFPGFAADLFIPVGRLGIPSLQMWSPSKTHRSFQHARNTPVQWRYCRLCHPEHGVPMSRPAPSSSFGQAECIQDGIIHVRMDYHGSYGWNDGDDYHQHCKCNASCDHWSTLWNFFRCWDRFWYYQLEWMRLQLSSIRSSSFDLLWVSNFLNEVLSMTYLLWYRGCSWWKLAQMHCCPLEKQLSTFDSKSKVESCFLISSNFSYYSFYGWNILNLKLCFINLQVNRTVSLIQRFGWQWMHLKERLIDWECYPSAKQHASSVKSIRSSTFYLFLTGTSAKSWQEIFFEEN